MKQMIPEDQRWLMFYNWPNCHLFIYLQWIQKLINYLILHKMSGWAFIFNWQWLHCWALSISTCNSLWNRIRIKAIYLLALAFTVFLAFDWKYTVLQQTGVPSRVPVHSRPVFLVHSHCWFHHHPNQEKVLTADEWINQFKDIEIVKMSKFECSHVHTL